MGLPRAARFALVTGAALWITGCASNGVLYYGEPTQKMTEMRHDYVRNNPNNRFNDDILVGRVHPGMTRLQVRVAWGEPDRVHKGDRAGIDQVWTYEEDEPSRGESFFQMRFYRGVLHEIAMTRGSNPQLIMNDPRDEISYENNIDAGANTTQLK